MITGEVYPGEDAEILVEAIKTDYSGEDIDGITNPIVYVKHYKENPVQAVGSTAVYNSTMGQVLITIPSTYVPSSGTFDFVLKGDDIADVLGRIQVNTSDAAITAIKAKTDLLTLAAINAELDTAISDAALATSASVSALHNLSAQQVWEYATRTLTAIPTGAATSAELTAIKGAGWSTETLKAIKDAQITNANVLTQVTTGFTNYAPATAANLAAANTNILSVKASTDNLTLANIKSQCTSALTDAAIPTAVWDEEERTLTSSGNGATAQEVWEYATRTITAVPTGCALTTDITSAISDLKGVGWTSETLKALMDAITNISITAEVSANDVVEALFNESITASTYTTEQTFGNMFYKLYRNRPYKI